MSRFLTKILQPYVAGEQPKQEDNFIKLNTNESPYPPAKGVQEAVCEKISSLQLYCDYHNTELTNVFAEYYNISTNHVIFGNGSDEILAFCYLAFGKNGVCFPNISYGFYPVFAQLFEQEIEQIPLQSDFTIDIKQYFHKKKTIIIANPNAPTGISLTATEIEQILIHNPDNVVIIDEAYVDFGAESVVFLTEQYDNLIVSGTFSKSRNLAGARLGFAIAHADLISDLNQIKHSYNPYNINSLTQMAGIASLKDDDYFKKCTSNIIMIREDFISKLEALNFHILPSKANFIFTKSNDMKGKILYEQLREKSILVRHFDKENLSDFLRITIGTAEQMEALLQAIQEILEEYNA